MRFGQGDRERSGVHPPRKSLEGRWKIGVVRRYRQHFGRLIDDYHGIVLVKDAKLPPIVLS
jgi:hypothetical protein